MSARVAPHRPTAEEIQAAKDLGLPSDDEYTESLLKLVFFAVEERCYDDALTVLVSIIRSRPDDYRLYEAFAIVYQMLGRDEEAMECYAEALVHEPESLHALTHLGELCWRVSSDAPRAQRLLGKASRLDPKGAYGRRASRSRARIPLPMASWCDPEKAV